MIHVGRNFGRGKGCLFRPTRFRIVALLVELRKTVSLSQVRWLGTLALRGGSESFLIGAAPFDTVRSAAEAKMTHLPLCERVVRPWLE